MIETFVSLWNGSSIYVQLFRFFVVLMIGTSLTRIVLVPTVKRFYPKDDEKALHSLENLTVIFGLFIAFTLALQAGSFGGLVGLITALGAAVTVAVGFGMRDQVSNLVAGLLIHLDNPFIKNDYIKVDETEGVVQDISLRATTLNGGNNKKQIVPNAMLTTGVVKNYTKSNKTKASIETKVNLKNAEEASNFLMESINESEETLESPKPEISFKKIENNELDMDATFWVKKSSEVKRARSDVLKRYTGRMKESGLLDEEPEKEE
ncbi:MAG: mechanosensitive ion channel [Candidatus Nanohaloarchaea archaeon]